MIRSALIFLFGFGYFVFSDSILAKSVNPTLVLERIILHDPQNQTEDETGWQVELASDDESLATGLMWRKSMALGKGMLFRFAETRPVSMWMKNTFIPLDMVFMTATGKITNIHYSAVPQSLEVINSKGPVRFVLEINAGEADRTKLKVGDVLSHPWFLPSE